MRRGLLATALLALAAGAQPLPRRRLTKPRKSWVTRSVDDDERIAAAQAKRERKNAKRVRVPDDSTDSGEVES